MIRRTPLGVVPATLLVTAILMLLVALVGALATYFGGHF